jgi:cytochrome b561
VTIWIVTAFRLAWRLTNAKLPPFLATMTDVHRAAVHASEYGLHALLLGQPATGLGTTLFGGRPFALLSSMSKRSKREFEVRRSALMSGNKADPLGVLLT